jgi:hypothetical protein
MKSLIVSVVLLLVAIGAGAAEDEFDGIGDWLAPSIHINAAVGESSAEHPEELMAGHHDPTREDGTVQGIELGLSLRTPFHLQGFATYNIAYGYEEEWNDKWEEAFLKLADLPGGFSLRGGRLLARFGLRNNIHLHGWNTVDTPLVLGRFLGDDGLSIDGGDATWIGEADLWQFGLIGGYGEVNAHGHGHGDEDEDHEHSHVESWDDDIYYGRAFARFQNNDFQSWQLGISAAGGDNAAGSNIPVWGTDLKYEWRENGFAPGGRAFVWNSEVLWRDMEFEAGEDIDHHHEEHEAEEDHHHDEHGADEHEHHDIAMSKSSEWGFYSEGLFSWNETWTTGLRLGYVEGIDSAGLEERYRLSPILKWTPKGNDLLAFRLQYNYDHLEESEEHSIWAQISLSWGGPEVR